MKSFSDITRYKRRERKRPSFRVTEAQRIHRGVHAREEQRTNLYETETVICQVLPRIIAQTPAFLELPVPVVMEHNISEAIKRKNQLLIKLKRNIIDA